MKKFKDVVENINIRFWHHDDFEQLERLKLATTEWVELHIFVQEIDVLRFRRKIQRICERKIDAAKSIALDQAVDFYARSWRLRRICFARILTHNPSTFAAWKKIYETLSVRCKEHLERRGRSTEGRPFGILPSNKLTTLAYKHLCQLARTERECWYVWREQWKPLYVAPCLDRLYEIWKKRSKKR